MTSRAVHWLTIFGFGASLVACGGGGSSSPTSSAVTTAGVPTTADATTVVATTDAPTTVPTTLPATTLPATLTLKDLPGRLAVTATSCGTEAIAPSNNVQPAVLCSMNPDGSDVRQLSAPGDDAAQPAWSYDGVHLIYFDQKTSTIIVDPATGAHHARQPGEVPAFWMSPDGNRKLYVGRDGISIGRPTGGDTTVIVHDTHALVDTEPSWAPDNTHFAYLSDTDGKGGSLPCDEVWVGAVDGSPPVQITHAATGPDGPAACPTVVRWSPDGSKILVKVTGLPAFTSDNLYVMNPDGTGLTALTHATTNPEAGGQPPAGAAFYGVWSPDNTAIALIMSDGQQFGLYVMRADGTGLTKVAGAPGDLRELAWAPA